MPVNRGFSGPSNHVMITWRQGWTNDLFTNRMSTLEVKIFKTDGMKR